MTIKDLGTNMDRQWRIDLNNNFRELSGMQGSVNDAINKAKTAEQIANEAKAKADTANNTSNSVQEQFNEVVIKGDSSVEAAQARVDDKGVIFNTLKERIDAEQSKIDEIKEDSPSWEFKGNNVTAFKPGILNSVVSERILIDSDKIGIDTIVINQIGHLDTATSNTITSNIIPEEEIEAFIVTAKSKGFKVVLKTLLDSKDKTWRAYLNPSDINLWFSNLTNWLLTYANMAQRNNVEMFCFGAEMRSLTTEQYRTNWQTVINTIKNVYKGKLTYGANFGAMYEYDEISTCCFFDLLDYAGVNMWHGHTEKNDPTVKELIDSWTLNKDNRSILRILLNWQKTHGKPIVFTECGINAVDGGNKSTGAWNYPITPTEDLQEQADWYKSFFEVFKHQTDVVKGSLFWSSNVDNSNDGFNFLNRPAGNIIKEYWGVHNG